MTYPAIDLGNIKEIYQHYIGEMIDKLGKNITLVMVEESVVNDNEDGNLPDWKSPSTKIERVTQSIKGLIEYDPRDFRKFAKEIEKGSNILQVKTYLRHINSIKTCLYIEPSADSQHTIPSRYRLIRAPIPIGLGEDAFVLTFWEQI